MPLTKQERRALAEEITAAMSAAYAILHEDGDFADCARYLEQEATDDELLASKELWAPEYQA